ncbi:MAG: peptidoglycan DD-metalloendopeptidase family protein [Desulfovibrionales bacterium]
MSDSGFDLGMMQAGNLDGLRLEQKLRTLRPRPGQEQTREEREKALMESCQGFETIFLSKLWQQMRSTIPKEGFLHGKQEEFYLSMFDHEIARKMAEGQGMGIGRMMFEQLKERLDEASVTTSPSTMTNPVPLDPLPLRPTPDSATGPLTPQTAADRHPSVMERVEALARAIEDRHGAQNVEKAAEANPLSGSTTSSLPVLTWPVEGTKSSDFGWRNDPFTGKRAWHAGVDFVAEEGAEIKACWPGTVAFSGDWGGYGRTVILEHEGGWKSIYAHTSRNTVQEGQTISAGQKIAELGNTGRSTGPHLHFELRQGEQAWDPSQIHGRMVAGLSIGKRV